MASFEDGGYPTKTFAEWMAMWRNGADDWSSGSLDWKTVNCDKWHYPYGCGVCKRAEADGVKLQRCGGCKVTRYCSQAHQKRAWPKHKRICKHLKAFYDTVDVQHVQTAAQWRQFLLMGQGALVALTGDSSIVQHPMINDEWMFQQHCQVCFYNPAARNTEHRTLVPCQLCPAAGHCPNALCAQQFQYLHTPEACELYHIGLASIVMSMQQGNLLVLNCNSRAATLSLPNNWKEYFTRKIGDFEVPQELIVMPPVMAMLTDGLSIAMTLLRSLAAVYGASVLASKQRLEVHMLGAGMAEINALASKFEEVVHWLPACRELVIVLVVGDPQHYETFGQALNQQQHVQLCPACARARTTLSLRAVSGLYHELMASGAMSLSTAPPDAVMACHSGLHDMGTPGNVTMYTTQWEPTVRMLTNTDIPCIWTGYNAEEIVRDTAKLHEWGAKVVVEGHLNPFRGLRPFPDVGEDNKFYYSNHSCVVTRGSAV